MKKGIFIVLGVTTIFYLSCSDNKNYVDNKSNRSDIPVEENLTDKIDDSTLINFTITLKKIEKEINTHKKEITTLLYNYNRDNENFHINSDNIDALKRLNLLNLNFFIKKSTNSLLFWTDSDDIIFQVKKNINISHTIIFSKDKKTIDRLSNTIMYEKHIIDNWQYRIIALLPKENTGSY